MKKKKEQPKPGMVSSELTATAAAAPAMVLPKAKKR